MFLNPQALQKELSRLSKGVEVSDLANWKAVSWAQVIATAAGVNSFGKTAKIIIPPAFQVFLPNIEMTITAEDQKLAKKALKHALKLVNETILEATKHMYYNVCQFAGGVEVPGFEQLIEELKKDLLDPTKRIEYFNAGSSMMNPEESWIGKHHLLAVYTLNELKTSKVISDAQYLSLAVQVGILVDGKPAYDPFSQIVTSVKK